MEYDLEKCAQKVQAEHALCTWEMCLQSDPYLVNDFAHFILFSKYY